MSPLDGLSIAEKIVWLFSERVSEAHRAAVEMTLGISEEQFDQAIARARDLGVDSDIWLTPVYEREGWWTARPTRRIVARAERESVQRNLGEAKRNHRVFSNFFGERIAHAVGVVEAGLSGCLAIVDALPEMAISDASDYILNEIDATPANRPYIYRTPAAVAP